MKLTINPHVRFRINFCPSVTLENKIDSPLLPNPREDDFGSVTKIKKIISKLIKIQRF